jgi:hypothetical protein
MALGDDIRARLVARVPALGGRVQAAADLAALQRSGGWPGVTPAAHVVPMGLAGGAQAPVFPRFRQKVDRLWAVILTIRSHDATGAKWIDRVEDLEAAILDAMLGWAPLAHAEAFLLKRATLIRFEAGTMVREMTFALTDTVETEQ